MQDALRRFMESPYYEPMEIIGSHAVLRRLWIEEGERRGFELVDA